jgi:malate dehydrogenase (quinone)
MQHFELIIVGGGISGTATLFEAARYTDIKSILLLEKYNGFAPLNSNSRSNSQTLHRGDIETNIGIDKAQGIRDAADMITRYGDHYLSAEDKARILRSYSKMVIGVGDQEVSLLRDRLERLGHLFPNWRALSNEELAKAEPLVMEGREDEVLALYSDQGYAVDYGALAESFAWWATNTPEKRVVARRGANVREIVESYGGYVVVTQHDTFTANAVIVSAGAHSLLLAKTMGYGKNHATLPVAGNFYWSSHPLLNGKVYTVQNDKLPFAAVHGDPDLNFPERTRFGPTAKVLGVLERGNGLKTFTDFLRSFGLRPAVIATLLKELMDEDVRKFLLRNNITYSIPVIGKRAFAADARKIIPTLSHKDLQHAPGIGGIRPQVIDVRNRKLLKGEARIEQDGIVFNMTPSPGATNCLRNAEKDIRYIAEQLGAKIDEDRFAELKGGNQL